MKLCGKFDAMDCSDGEGGGLLNNFFAILCNILFCNLQYFMLMENCLKCHNGVNLKLPKPLPANKLLKQTNDSIIPQNTLKLENH